MPLANGHHKLRPVSHHARIAIPMTGAVKSGIAAPTKRFNAVRSNSGDSSSTAIASMTSSTNGR
ncbi:Uncharacterised protein [Mycobacterium tuberculosis]|nr:Uncharacterised protein [Mycobacterium tuberculosis]